MSFFIPKKLTVGFVKREDTFTGKLAFVVYHDDKGKLRQETSWNGWRDHKIKPITIDNIPSRFVINKGIQRSHYFGSGISKIRIYDERDFEFEITIDNLIALLMHSDVSKRDIQETCVFAWKGKDLTLLPINSEEYLEATKHTEKQSLKLSSKDLIPGYAYSTKKNNINWIYLGQYEYFSSYDGKNVSQSFGKQHVFFNPSSNSKASKNFLGFDKPYEHYNVSDLAEVVNSQTSPEFSNMVTQFINSIYHKGDKKIIRIAPANSKDTLEEHYFFPYSKYNSEGELLSLKIENGKIISLNLKLVCTEKSGKAISYTDYYSYRQINNIISYNFSTQISNIDNKRNTYPSFWTESKKLESLKSHFSSEKIYTDKDILKILTKLKFGIPS